MTTPSAEPGKSGCGTPAGGTWVGSLTPPPLGFAATVAGAVVGAAAAAVVGAAGAVVGLAAGGVVGALAGAVVAAGGVAPGLHAASSAEIPTKLVPRTNCRRLSLDLTKIPPRARLHP